MLDDIIVTNNIGDNDLDRGNQLRHLLFQHDDIVFMTIQLS